MLKSADRKQQKTRVISDLPFAPSKLEGFLQP